MISSARQWCFGLRHYRLCVVLVSREDGFPTDVLWPTSTVVLTPNDSSWILRELLQDCPAFGVHTNTVPDLSLRVHSVCFSDYFIAGSLHLWRLQPARSRSLAFTRILSVIHRHRPTHLIIPVARTSTSSGSCRSLIRSYFSFIPSHLFCKWIHIFSCVFLISFSTRVFQLLSTMTFYI